MVQQKYYHHCTHETTRDRSVLEAIEVTLTTAEGVEPESRATWAWCVMLSFLRFLSLGIETRHGPTQSGTRKTTEHINRDLWVQIKVGASRGMSLRCFPTPGLLSALVQTTLLLWASVACLA